MFGKRVDVLHAIDLAKNLIFRVVPRDNIPHNSPQVFGKRVDVLYLNDSDENLLLGYERNLAEFVFS